MTAAAMTGPTPNSPVRLVPVAATAVASLLAGLADPGVDAAQVLDEGRGELAAGRRHRVRRCDRRQDPGGLACGDRLGDAAGDQLAQAPRAAGTRPGCGCGPGHGSAWTRSSAPPRDHRAGPPGRRPSAARRRRPTGHRWGRSCSCPRWPAAGPARPAWAAHPAPAHPAASSCWASRWPRPPAPSTAQVRCGQAAAHASSRSAWAAAGADPQLTQRLLRRADRHRRMRGLVRIDPDHHCRHERPLPPRAR